MKAADFYKQLFAPDAEPTELQRLKKKQYHDLTDPERLTIAMHLMNREQAAVLINEMIQALSNTTTYEAAEAYLTARGMDHEDIPVYINLLTIYGHLQPINYNNLNILKHVNTQHNFKSKQRRKADPYLLPQ